jgi:hypothetical protein
MSFEFVIPGRPKGEPGIQRLMVEILGCATAHHSSMLRIAPE